MSIWIFSRSVDGVLLDPPFVVSRGGDEIQAKANAGKISQGVALGKADKFSQGVEGQWENALGTDNAMLVGLDRSPSKRV
jgi:hypothetical protein